MSAGKSPHHDRVIELLRAGRTSIDITLALGIPHSVVKRWARKAGITIGKPTQEQRTALEQRLKRAHAQRRDRELEPTARKVAR